MAEKIKEAKKTVYFASLRDVPSSPRKMRYVADLVRGMEVSKALATLKFNSKSAAKDIEKVLRSAIANWEQKNDRKAENGELYISKIFVDEGATLKRMRPAPQGRGSGLLSRLEKKGFIEFRPDPEDRRCKRICISPRGRECTDTMHSIILDNEARLVQGFTPEEQEQFRGFLERAIRNMGCHSCSTANKEEKQE